MVGTIALGGCFSERDISNNPEYPTDFRLNAVYRAQKSLVVHIYHGPFETALEVLSVGDASDVPESHPKTGIIRDFEIFYLLPAGTEIRITMIHRFWAEMDVGSRTVIRAEILSGTYNGLAVNIDAICHRISSPTIDKGLLVRNREILAEKIVRP
jgi:hypothetical protein